MVEDKQYKIIALPSGLNDAETELNLLFDKGYEVITTFNHPDPQAFNSMYRQKTSSIFIILKKKF
jgi:hypothetical protein